MPIGSTNLTSAVHDIWNNAGSGVEGNSQKNTNDTIIAANKGGQIVREKTYSAYSPRALWNGVCRFVSGALDADAPTIRSARNQAGIQHVLTELSKGFSDFKEQADFRRAFNNRFDRSDNGAPLRKGAVLKFVAEYEKTQALQIEKAQNAKAQVASKIHAEFFAHDMAKFVTPASQRNTYASFKDLKNDITMRSSYKKLTSNQQAKVDKWIANNFDFVNLALDGDASRESVEKSILKALQN